MQQIALGKTLDVEIVEQELLSLWQGSTGAPTPDDETAVLRARAANLLVFVSEDKALTEVHELLQELTAAHPSRVLMMLAESQAPDRDIEMFVSALSQKEKPTGLKRLCCEEVTLKAQEALFPNFRARPCRCWFPICRHFFGGALWLIAAKKFSVTCCMRPIV